MICTTLRACPMWYTNRHEGQANEFWYPPEHLCRIRHPPRAFPWHSKYSSVHIMTRAADPRFQPTLITSFSSTTSFSSVCHIGAPPDDSSSLSSACLPSSPPLPSLSSSSSRDHHNHDHASSLSDDRRHCQHHHLHQLQQRQQRHPGH